MDENSLYDLAFDIVKRNESLYDRYENEIAAYMAKRWQAGFALGKEVSGSENPTVMEVADMGADAIDDRQAFLSDLYEVFRTLAKDCQLNHLGEWC